MPEIPIILPMIVLGLTVGAIIKSKIPRISKKKLFSASLGAGLLNSIHAYLLYSLTPTQTFSPPAGVTMTRTFTPPAGAITGGLPPAGVASTSEPLFIAASFLAGLLAVFLVLGIAAIYARGRNGEELEDAAEAALETPQEETPLMSN